MDTNPHLQKAIELVGSQAELANRLSALSGKEVKQQNISYWLHNGVPKKWARYIASIAPKKLNESDLAMWQPNEERSADMVLHH